MAVRLNPGIIARKTIIPILFLLFGTGLAAQGILSGIVRSESTGEALPGAHVSIEGTYLATVSDSKGFFRLSGIGKGNQTIKVSYIGFQTLQQEIEIGNMERTLDLKLAEAAIMGEEATIRATRAGHRSPTAFSTIERKQIEELNAGQDIPYLFSMTPAVVISSDAGAGIGYTSFRIRGTDLNRINITVNGIPLNDAESHGVWWVDLPDFASSVENLQIQRGVGTSSNGAAAFGASVNLQSATPPAKPYARYSNNFGSFRTLRNTVSLGTGMIDGRWNVEGRFSDIRSDGYIDRAFAELGSWYLGAGYYGDRTIVRAKAFSGRERTYQAWDGIPSSILDTNRTYNGIGAYDLGNGETAYYDNETDNYRQDHYQLFINHELGQGLRLNVAFHYTRGIGYYEQYKSDRGFSDYLLPQPVVGSDTIWSTDLIQRKYLDNHFYGAVYSLEYTRGRWNLIAGGGMNRYDGWHYGKVIWQEWSGSPYTDHEWYRSQGIKDEVNNYVKAGYELTPKLYAYADLQYRFITHTITGVDDDLRDITQEHRFPFLNPKAGLYFAPSDRHSLFLSVAVAHREPNRSNFTDADPSLGVPRPERLTDYEAGYTYRAGRFRLKSTLYYMDYHDQLVLTGEINDVGAPIMTNVESSYRAGIEWEADWNILKGLDWSLNLALSRNKVKDFTTYVDDWDTWTQVEEYIGSSDLAFSPAVVAGSVLRYAPVPKLSASLYSKYVSKQYIDNTSSPERQLDAYMTHDIRVAYNTDIKGMARIELSLRVNNILNEEYETNAWVYRYYEGGQARVYDGYFPQAGTHFLAGVNIIL